MKVLFLPDSRKNEIMRSFSSQEVVSTVQLLIKLSESLNILEQNRVSEIKDENKLFATKQVLSFFLAMTGTILILMLLGFTS